MSNITKILNRHQLVCVYLAFAAGVSGYAAGRIVNESVLVSILIVLNAIVITYACSNIEYKTISKNYTYITEKDLSPLQSYVYLKAERYWLSLAGIVLAIGFMLAYFIESTALSIALTAITWVTLSAILWKLYADTVYASFQES